MHPKFISTALIGVSLLVSGSGNAQNSNLSTLSDRPTDQVRDARTEPPVEPRVPIPSIPAPNYSAIVERFGPTVVGINTEASATAASGGMPEGLEGDPFFKFFRGIPGLEGRVPGPGNGTPVHGQGSGFIVGSDGLILTNAHVVRNATEVTVKLSDRREFKAKVLGSDPSTDVAVLKIDAKNLPVVNIGDPSRLGVGDYVLAIGSPFGFEHSATSGIVSAKGRSLPGDSFVPFIQTDVAVNPGNSGGPLFDAFGNVVGINSQIYSRSGGYQGVSFAIPIDVALNVKEQIVATGKVRHARLGVTLQELNQALADSFGLNSLQGALVSSVAPESAAQKAGLRPGDVILKYNEKPISRTGDLTAQIGAAKPGDKASFEIWRNGKRQDVSTTLMAAGGSGDQADDPGAAGNGRLGLAVRPLTPQEQQAGGVNGGLVVQQSGGPAAKAGIQVGDIIVSVNGHPVKSAEDIRKYLANNKKNLALLIQRSGQNIFVPVPLG